MDDLLLKLRKELRAIDQLTVNKIRVRNEEDEKKYGVKRSPTIRLNGHINEMIPVVGINNTEAWAKKIGIHT